MAVYIALLRGVNVTGTKMSMNDLKALLSGADYSDVSTYIQSGNIVFSHRKTAPEQLEQQLSALIGGHFGFKVPVIIRTPGELQAVLDDNPFLAQSLDETKLYQTFLATTPAAAAAEQLRTYDYPPDQFVLRGKEVYVYCPDGYGRTKLNNTFFERRLKVTATTRNLKTVRTLIGMAGQ